jgi:hypothetical protein
MWKMGRNSVKEVISMGGSWKRTRYYRTDASGRAIEMERLAG